MAGGRGGGAGLLDLCDAAGLAVALAGVEALLAGVAVGEPPGERLLEHGVRHREGVLNLGSSPMVTGVSGLAAIKSLLHLSLSLAIVQLPLAASLAVPAALAAQVGWLAKALGRGQGWEGPRKAREGSGGHEGPGSQGADPVMGGPARAPGGRVPIELVYQARHQGLKAGVRV